jgi:hypothetical protein
MLVGTATKINVFVINISVIAYKNLKEVFITTKVNTVYSFIALRSSVYIYIYVQWSESRRYLHLVV